MPEELMMGIVISLYSFFFCIGIVGFKKIGGDQMANQMGKSDKLITRMKPRRPALLMWLSSSTLSSVNCKEENDKICQINENI